MSRNHRGLSCVEMLVMVGVVVIMLAAALPPFIEAQARSKYTECRQDLQAIGQALEAYALENHAYPPSCDRGAPQCYNPQGSGFHSRITSYLTTPIAYMHEIQFDPFVGQATTDIGRRYVFFSWDWFLAPEAGANPYGYVDFYNGAKAWTGQWLLYGYGPDLRAFHGPAATFRPYDPTNGTISIGNIVSTQKNTNGIDPHPLTGTFRWN